MLYFDTSYIVRLYCNDPGWERVRDVASGQIACSALGRIETASAFHRKFREKQLTKREFELAFAAFESEQERFVWLPMDDVLLIATTQAFKALPPKVYLRASDGLHLATAAANGFAEIYSNDRHLLEAASYFGIRGRNAI